MTSSAQLRLLARIENRRASGTIQPRGNTDPVPLSFAQRRLWFLDRLEPGSAEYVVPSAFRLVGTVDVQALESAFSTIVARHEVLRTRFVSRADGEPVQVVGDPWPVLIREVDLRAEPERARELLDLEAVRGFDLATDRLVRVMLIRTGADESLLLVSMHHIVTDGWSMDVFGRELQAAYQGQELPGLAIQYGDFAAWQHEWLTGPVLTQQLAYWRERLAGVEPLALPTDRPRPKIRTTAGDGVPFTVPADVSTALRRLAAEHGASLSMVGLAAFLVVLSRWSGQEDICVGTPIAGRNRHETEDLIGFFVNTLVLRADVSSDLTFGDLLDQVKSVALDAYAHQDLPFERLVEELSPERDLSRNPLVQVVFATEQAGGAAWELPGTTAHPLDINPHTAKFDLAVFLSETDTGVGGVAVYATSLFDRVTIERLVAHLLTTLRAVADDTTQRVHAIDILSPAERDTLRELAGSPTPFADQTTVAELVRAQASRTPDAIAVTCGDDRLTYADLNTRANRLARHLHAQGVRVESLVGVCQRRGIDLVVTALAVLKAGGAYVPLDPDYPAARLAFMAQDTAAPLIVTESALRERLTDLGVPLVVVDDDQAAINQWPDDDPQPSAGPENLAYVIYTSGSTGVPKGVMVEHRSICRLVDRNTYADIDPSDVVAQVSSFSFDAFTFECWAALVSGASMVILDKDTALNTDEFAARLRDQGVTTLFLTSALFHRHLLDRPDVFAGLKTVLYGGELIDRGTADALVAGPYAPGHVGHVYGPTETTTFATHHHVPVTPRSNVSMPIGGPIANTEVFVVDRWGGLAPVGVPGELWIGGPGVARGYWKRPELTEQRFVPHPFDAGRVYRTGDLVRWLPSGDLEFLGRVDRQVKLRGQRIELGEIESVLAGHPRISTAVVILREDTPGDARLVAYCVADDAIPAVDLRDWCRTSLPDYMIPSAFVFLGTLPLTPNGKVDRDALPVPEGERADLARGYVAPRSALETVIAEIWGDVLGVERVGIEDDFFALGGHSLLVTRVINRIATATGHTVSVRDVFAAPTVAALTDILSTTDNRLPRLERRGRTEVALSFAQRRLWFFDQVSPGSAEYVVPYAFHITGELDVRALESAFTEVVRRHEVLRTRFVTGQDGEPRQFVLPPWPVQIDTVDVDPAQASALLEAEAERPFDLTSGRLLRVLLARTAPDTYQLLVSTHHIITDGWSMEVLGRDLKAFYAADGADMLPVQYADYAEWQREWLTGQVFEDWLAYWRTQLAGATPSALPTDRPRPVNRSGAGDVVRFTIPADLADQVRRMASRHGVSLFMLSLAAFQIVLSRWSGEDDICVGSPIAGRTRPEIEDLIGFFVNTIVLRADLADNPSFAELLAQVKETVLAGLAHQDLPFELLVAELAPDRDPSRNPLFQVAFAVQGVTGEDWTLPGLLIKPIELKTATSNFDLTLFLSEMDDGTLRGNAVFATELFDPATIERLVGHFVTVLASVVADDRRPVGAIDLLSSAEREQILALNPAPVPFADNTTVHELFARQTAARPEATALVFGVDRLTYGELDARANQVAHRLRHLGVGVGDRVAICLHRGIDLIVAVLGTLKAGAAYVPLDPDYPQARLEFMLTDSEASLVITDTGLPKLPGPRLLTGEERQDPTGSPAVACGPNDLAYVMYTSGSTGAPKGVMIEHRSICRLVDHNTYADIGPSDVVAQTSSFSFDAFTFECWSTLVSGASMMILDKDTVLNADELAARLRDHRVTTLFLTSALFHRHLLDRPDAFAGLKTVLYGGELIDRGTADALVTGPYAPEHLVNGYGPTETTTFATHHQVPVTPRSNVSMPIGVPIANTEVFVMDRWGGLAPTGVAGELWIGGPGVARGYWKRPELTEQRFVPHPFGTGKVYRSGDLVRWLPSGDLEFLGRVDRQVKLRGQRIELGEIESVLASYPRISNAVVILREDTPGDKTLAAYCVADGEIEVPALIAWCRDRLPAHMVPAGFVLLDVIPLTPNGKVDQRALPTPKVGDVDGYQAPSSAVETTIAGVWADVLGLDRVSVHDNFFALGGHSLRAVVIATRLRAAGVDVSVGQLLKHQTVAELARAVANHERAGGLLVELSASTREPTLFCVHAGGGSVHWYHPLAERLRDAYRVVGIQAAGMSPDEQPIESIPEMAARYWAEITAAQPVGPYHLLGWSMGAVVVHEMARLRPDDVAMAHLLEPPLIEPGVRARLLSYVDQYRQADQLWHAGQTATGATRASIEARLRSLAEPLEVDDADVSLDDWLPFQTLGLLIEAVVRYQPASSSARARLVISDAVATPSNHSDGDVRRYLDSWRRPYRHEVPSLRLDGDHMAMVAEPQALDRLVTSLRESWERR